MVVNSLITNIKDGQRVAAGQDVDVRGIAWDAGYGIRDVDVSADGGRTWYAAELGQDLGRFLVSHVELSLPAGEGRRVSGHGPRDQSPGSTQTAELIFNPAGYHNNVMQRIVLVAA